MCFDDDDIRNQMRLLYGRANVLIRKFSKCSRDVKLCLFKTYCTNFYGIELWSRYSNAVIKRMQAAYVKCIKMFFGFEKRQNVSEMFLTLGLPTFDTLRYNAKRRFINRTAVHNNSVVTVVHNVCT